VSTRQDPPRRRIKMKDLERATGVGREAIRYYIREGLLPEPERPERNVAWYDASFVERILLIKRLQSERFLPLSVIKGIVGDGRELTANESEALLALDGHIVPAGERERPHAAETVARLAKRIGLSAKEIRELADVGAVEIVVRDGKQCLEGSSVAVAEAWGRVRGAGFSDELGFGTADVALYVEVVQWLAREELHRFGARVAAKVDAETARRMAHEGIEHVNEMLARLRESVLLRAIAEGNLAVRDAGDAAG
jgi:DNA-binding transcriptional MerR regulator